MRVDYDPSFLIALCLAERLSPRARAFVEQQGQPLRLNELQELEFRNGLRQKVVRREVSEADLARCLAVFQQDGVAGKVRRKAVAWAAVFAKAESLSGGLGVRQVCRSFDRLPVAISAVSADPAVGLRCRATRRAATAFGTHCEASIATAHPA